MLEQRAPGQPYARERERDEGDAVKRRAGDAALATAKMKPRRTMSVKRSRSVASDTT
jgi:hypothetical protein